MYFDTDQMLADHLQRQGIHEPPDALFLGEYEFLSRALTKLGFVLEHTPGTNPVQAEYILQGLIMACMPDYSEAIQRRLAYEEQVKQLMLRTPAAIVTLVDGKVSSISETNPGPC
jgi:hypothetical protein